MTEEPEWTTINDAADRTGKSRRTIWRTIRDYNVDTGTREKHTIVHMRQLRRALAKIKRGRREGSVDQHRYGR